MIFNRREFVQTSVGAIAGHLSPTLFAQLKKPLRLGLIIGIGKDPETAIATVLDLGLPTCQVYVEDFEQGLSTRLLQALDKHQIEATSVVVGGPGREMWDFFRRAADDWRGSARHARRAHRPDKAGV